MPAAAREMPKYECRGVVWALEIAHIAYSPLGIMTLTPVDEEFDPFEVSGAYVETYIPQVGGYYVVYDDGSKGYSPKAAFENGYTRI